MTVKKPKLAWFNRLIEIPIIVGSILLALYFENWNDQINQKEAEQEYLTNLHDEFSINLTEVVSDQKFRLKQIDYTKKLIQLINNGQLKQTNKDSIESWIQYLLPVRFYSPTHAVLDDIINSGNIKLIESSSIRRAIMRYTNLVQKGIFIENEEFTFVQHFELFLIDNGSYRFFLNDDQANDIKLSSTDWNRIINLMQSLQFIDYLNGRLKKLEETIYFTEPKEHVIKRILDLINTNDIG